MSTDAHPTPSAHAEATTIRGRLGPSAIMFMVIAAAAPLTVVGGLVPIGILAGNGLGFPVMFLAASAILLLFSVGLMALVRHIPETGTFSSYIGAGLGFRAGAAAAGLALTCYSAVQAAVFSYLGLLTDLTERYLGPIGSIVVTLLFIGSMFAAVLSLHNVVARYNTVWLEPGWRRRSWVRSTHVTVLPRYRRWFKSAQQALSSLPSALSASPPRRCSRGVPESDRSPSHC